jgi:hypothetical protein
MSNNTSLSPLAQSIVNRLSMVGEEKTLFLNSVRQGPRTRAAAASFSRALRRLAKRGLVELRVYRPARKGEAANAVRLTPKGRALASGIRS